MGSADTHGFEPIPQPPEHLYGLLGNIPDIDPSFPTKEIWRLCQIYGPIMKLNLNGPHIYVSNQKLVNEVCDETRFHKQIGLVLQEVRALTGDGLFTAFPKEPNWWKAHRMLVPAFGRSIQTLIDVFTNIYQDPLASARCSMTCKTSPLK